MMLEPEKLQNRGKQGWPDAGKGTGHKGDKKVNTLVRHKWTPIEQPNALGKQRLPKQGKNVCTELRCSHCHKHIYVQVPACTQAPGAHGPSHVVSQETVYKQRLLQLTQARPTMPAFTSSCPSVRPSVTGGQRKRFDP